MNTLTQIPRPIISIVSEVLANAYTHTQLNSFFMYANAPNDVPAGNKVDKCQNWLLACNSNRNCNPLMVLGKLLEDYMERELDSRYPLKSWEEGRTRIREVLKQHGLDYSSGGAILSLGFSGSTKSLKEILTSRDIKAVEVEFHRTIENINTDPPASLTSACAIIESACKLYIEENNLTPPKDITVKPLWNIIAKDLGFDPSKVEDDDLKKILTGLSSIVDGIGALRTHAGSAHGRGQRCYKIQPRHARLAVHASHTLTVFLLESWNNKKKL